MKIVSPYKPFVPDSAAHRKLGPFDWAGALRMLAWSAARCDTSVYALTDPETSLPIPAYRYAIAQPRLMLWILDVCLAYLESPDFDDDTVMVSPDALVFGDLSRWFAADLGLLARFQKKYVDADRQILNVCQWWRYRSKSRLIRFYRQAAAIARSLPEDSVRWGADTIPLARLVGPIVPGLSTRAGLTVRLIDYTDVLFYPSAHDVAALREGDAPTWPRRPVVDFKYRRKLSMAAYYDATIGSGVPA